MNLRAPTLFCMLALGACATTTPPPPQAVGPSLFQATGGKHDSPMLKRKVAVLRFSNETKYGRGVFGAKAPAIEKQAEDILKSRLVDSGAVLLVESSLTSNAGMPQMSTIGADYAILGSVSEFGRQITSETGIFSRTKKQVAYAAVNLRLIDTRTGLVIYSEEGRGEADIEAGRIMGVGTDAAYDSSINDKAISAAIGSLVGNVLNNLTSEAWRTGVLAIEGEKVMIAGGKTQGLSAGDVFAVRAQGRMVKNTQLGGMIELPGEVLGKIKVQSFFGQGIQEGAICQWIEGGSGGHPHEHLVVEEAQ